MKYLFTLTLSIMIGCGSQSQEKSEANQGTSTQVAQNNQPPAQKCQLEINEASQMEMRKMDGVGEAKAKAIIDYRRAKRSEATKNGEQKWNFNSWVDVMAIEGIGETICEKNKSKICFNGRPSFGCKVSGP